MSKILIWETLADIGGGQEMTLKIVDVLQPHHKLHFLIPQEGELSQQLKKRNIEYTIMGDQSMPRGEKGFKGLIRFAYLTVKAAINGRKAVRKEKPDILYAPGPAALAWSAMCGTKTTVIWHMHHMFQSGATLKLLNFLSARKCVKRIISVSDCVAGQITNARAVNKKLTIYNPVKAISADMVRKDICEEYPALRKELKIAQIGFITPTKGQLLSVEIVNNLKKRGYDVAFAIIGSVRDGDDNFKAMLYEKIREYDLGDNVVFTGYRTDVDSIIGSFDLVLVPSVEGFSLVAVQAIMENVPVLSLDNTGCAEIVRKSHCGMVFSGDSDISVIADTLIKTASMDVNEVKEKHPDFFLSECSYDKFCKKITDVFSV